MKEFIVENLLAGSTASFFDVAIKLFMALDHASPCVLCFTGKRISHRICSGSKVHDAAAVYI